MQFNHGFGFETSGTTTRTYWDGGVIEYSTDGGATWQPAGSLIAAGKAYGGTLHASNPLGAQPAFVDDSFGYVTTQLDLSPLVGQNVRVRFRLGADASLNDYGWYIDDVRIYSCASAPAGTITIVKDTEPDGPQDFSFTVTSGLSPELFVLDDDADGTLANSHVFTSVPAGSYSISEQAVDGSSLTGLTCMDPDDGTTVALEPRTVTIDLDADESVTCTFTSTLDPPPAGTIVIVEDTVPDGPQNFSFAVTGGLIPPGFGLDDDADGTLSNTRIFSSVSPGTYTVTEGVVGGFTLTGLGCSDPDGGSSTNLGTRTATIDLDPNETVTCTFTNEAQPPRATRHLLSCYVPGVVNTVKIGVAPPAGTFAHAVEDQPPPGWVASGISDGGAFDAVSGRVKWGPFLDGSSRTLTYEAVPPAGSTGIGSWTGLASFDGANEAIGGDGAIAGPCGFVPDYSPGDLRITVDEVTGYGACWRGGSCTSIAVLPALIAYVTRAGFLWTAGELFHRAPGCADFYPDDAQCWVPGAGPQTLAGAAVASRQPGGTARLGPLSPRPNGRSFDVTIALRPSRGTRAQAVEQRVPAGARVTRISDGGVYDAATRSVKWGPFLDDTPRTLTYRLTVRRGTTPSPRLVGRASFDGVVVRIR
jgi:hypothetical protein